jgi:hypothetical protein
VSLAELGAEERAMVCAALLDRGGSGGALARLPAGVRERVAREVAALAGRAREERVRVIVGEVQRVLLAGVDAGVHPSWRERALEGEAAAVVAAARGQRRVTTGVKRWLTRAVWGGLVAMPGPLADGAVPRSWADVPRLPAADLERAWLAMGAEAAARRMAPALAAAGGDVLVQTAQRLPWEIGIWLLEAPRQGELAGLDELVRWLVSGAG